MKTDSHDGGIVLAGVVLKHIGKVYQGGVRAVSDFNLKIKDKEFIVLVGPSGCGKSTTLRMIAGLEEISEGELYIDERIVNDVAPKERDIAMVFQNYALYPHMTVFENMAFGLKLRKVSKEEIKRRVDEAARILDIAHLLDRRPKALSGGQKQRVALGRAIVREPKVFLLDEPLSNLDAKLRAQMRTELSKLHLKLGTTFIYVTHDQTEAMTMADRIVVMKDGVIQQCDTPQILYDSPCNLFVAGFIGSPQMNFIEAKLTKRGDDVLVNFAEFALKIPKEKVLTENYDKLMSYGGKQVILGIRPEAIYDEEEMLEKFSDSIITVNVEVVEQMGSETYLYLDIKDNKFTARVSPYSKAKPGDVIKVALDMSKIHLFDIDTEETIIN